jgi:hypothetical protein
MRLARWDRTASAVVSFMGVAMTAGAIAFTRTPRGRQLVADRLGQADHSGLGGRVDRQVRFAVLALRVPSTGASWDDVGSRVEAGVPGREPVVRLDASVRERRDGPDWQLSRAPVEETPGSAAADCPLSSA